MPPQQQQQQSSTSSPRVATGASYVEETLNAMAGWLRVIGGYGVAWAGSLTRNEHLRRRGTRTRLVGDVQWQLGARASAIERTAAGPALRHAFREVRDRRFADGQMRHNQQRLQVALDVQHAMAAAADDAPMIIWIADENANCTYLNQQWCQTTGATDSSDLGARWLERIHPDDRPALSSALALPERGSVAMRPAPVRLELRLRQADGSWRYTLHSASPRFDQHGTLLGWIGSAIDLEERRVMEINLRTLANDLSLAHRQKDEFIATLAHELRNPLAPMRNSVELMRRLQPAAPDGIVKAREILERQLAQLARLVDDLLDVSRITSGKLELRRERASIETILQRALETSRPYIDGGAHAVTMSLPDTPLVVDGDVTRLSQVFSNLLNNAAKYSERARTIHLSALRDGTTVVVCVRDEGVGIAPDTLSHVFDLFMQVDHTLERSQGGLGIGLTLVKRLVELHGGSVDARSDGVGQGSEFSVRLPLDDAGTVAPRDDTLPTRRVPAPKRILVADDNIDAANSLAELLRLEGHYVQLASDGLQALEAAESTCPDVIFLDIGMPHLNGYETCERIRARPWSRHTILIALTGWGQLDDRRKSTAAGFDHHVVKPVDPGTLPALLRL